MEDKNNVAETEPQVYGDREKIDLVLNQLRS